MKNKKTKTLPKLIKECQEICNKYIRLRDSQNGYFKCISCGQIKNYYEMQAGHFHEVGKSSGLRFEPDNIHGECSGCNLFDQDHLINYTINLKNKIGAARFDELQRVYEYYRINKKRWAKYEIREKIEIFKTLIKEL